MTEKYLKRYLDLHPLNLDVLYSLGGLYYRLRKHGEARKVLETIFMFQPDHSEAKELAALVSCDPLPDEQRPQYRPGI
jgi:uncharacterized protein HemY